MQWGYPYPEDIPEEDIVFEANTIEELGELIGISPDLLAKTVENGAGPVFHRGERPFYLEPYTPKPLVKASFRATAISPGIVGTKGGPRLNGNAQVMHVSGEVIEGLYAMGNCSGVGAPSVGYGGERGVARSGSHIRSHRCEPHGAKGRLRFEPGRIEGTLRRARLRLRLQSEPRLESPPLLAGCGSGAYSPSGHRHPTPSLTAPFSSLRTAGYAWNRLGSLHCML